jgi:hypothetical protein
MGYTIVDSLWPFVPRFKKERAGSAGVIVNQELVMRKYMASLAISFVVAFGCMAQQPPKIVVDIPFQFKADQNAMPAGTYELQPNLEGTHIQLRNLKTDERYIARVFTSLASRESNQSVVVFDVEGQNHYLSEVHIAGIDGFALRFDMGKHTHITIPAKK